MFLEISQKFKGKHPCQSLFATLLKNRLAHVFSYGFCEIPKNTFSYRTRLVVGSADDFFGLHKNMNCISFKITAFFKTFPFTLQALLSSKYIETYLKLLHFVSTPSFQKSESQLAFTCTKLTKTRKRHQWRCSGVCFVNFEQISYMFRRFFCWLWTRKYRLGWIFYFEKWSEICSNVNSKATGQWAAWV